MERALKERIIGAVVLVAVVVLVVPVFLDGSDDGAAMRTEHVPLPGSGEQKTQTVVLERNREEPVPALTGEQPERQSAPAGQAAPSQARRPDASAPESDGAVTGAAAAPRTGPGSAPPVVVAASTTGMWAVQLGSFSNQPNAERLAADLRKQGFAAFLSRLDTSTGPLHRVRVGPQKDREAADAMAARLKKAGHKGQVVPHP